MRIYVADLSAYNAGRIVGEWVDLPTDEKTLQAVIDRLSHGGASDWAIHDYEAPFAVDEFDDVLRINEWAAAIEDADLDDAIAAVIVAAVDSRDEAVDIIRAGDYRVYWDCETMADVAYESLSESGLLEEIPEWAQGYFDYDAFGRDIALEGSFHAGRAASGPFFVEITR